MASFGTEENDGDFAFLFDADEYLVQLDQGHGFVMSNKQSNQDDDFSIGDYSDEYQLQPAQDDGFVMSNDEASIDQQSDQDDDISIGDYGDEYQLQLDQGDGLVMSNDEASIDQQPDQEDDDISIGDYGDLGDQQPSQADVFTESLTEAIRGFTPDGFSSHADADDPAAATYSEYHYIDLDFNFGSHSYETLPATPPLAYYHDDMDFEFEGEDYAVEDYPSTFEAALEEAEALADDCCAVCLQQDDGEEDATWRRVAACGHRFHAACVEEWLRVKPTCPVCRRQLAEEHPGILDVEELLALGYEVTEVSVLLVNVRLHQEQ